MMQIRVFYITAALALEFTLPVLDLPARIHQCRRTQSGGSPQSHSAGHTHTHSSSRARASTLLSVSPLVFCLGRIHKNKSVKKEFEQDDVRKVPAVPVAVDRLLAVAGRQDIQRRCVRLSKLVLWLEQCGHLLLADLRQVHAWILLRTWWVRLSTQGVLCRLLREVLRQTRD